MLVQKDLQAILGRKGIRALLTVLPVVLVVVIPVVYFVAISLLPTADNAQLPAVIRTLLPTETKELEYRQVWIEAFTRLLCPMLFLSVPIVCSVASASWIFVSEKENRTLETLLLSAMNPKTIFNAKIAACVLVSLAVSLISFVAFAVTVSVADILTSAPYFFSFDWLVMVVMLTPAVTLFSVVFVSLNLTRVYSAAESLQTMGYLLLPFIAMYLAQFSGAFQINALVLAAISIVLAALSIVIFNFSARKFQAESLLIRPAVEEA